MHAATGTREPHMDTTYFGRKWGVMVLYDAISKRALSVLEVRNETIERYRQGVAALQERGVVIQSIICDGRSGLLPAFPGILVQMCQFHQIKIIVRYLRKKPKSEAARELRALALTLTGSSKDRFIENLHDWLMRHEVFLNERSVNAETGRSHYTHKNVFIVSASAVNYRYEQKNLPKRYQSRAICASPSPAGKCP